MHLYFLNHFAWGRRKQPESPSQSSIPTHPPLPREPLVRSSGSNVSGPRGNQVFFDPTAAHIVQMQLQHQGEGTISDVFGPEFASRSFFGSVAAPSNASIRGRDEDEDA